jgi:elongation factor 1-alpha
MGLSQGDCGVMVVSGLAAEVEAGVKGQTLEHALLAYTYGIRQMVVCINKMDHPDIGYQEELYLKAKEQVGECMKKAGFNPHKMPFIPISAWEGDNLVDKSANMPWYKGPTLIELIDSVPEAKQTSEMPFRLAVENVFKMGKVGTVVTGKVLSGSVKLGMELVCGPKMLNCTVESMQINRTDIKEVGFNQSVGIHLSGVEPKDIVSGDVLGPRVNGAMGRAETFTAHIMLVGK